MITLSIDIGGGFQGVVPELGGLDGDLNDVFKGAMDQSVASILNRIRTTFLAEQDPTGAAWIPSHSGMARRKKGGTGTLFNTGRLFRSIQLSTLPDLGERGISTDVPYAEKHQFGQDGMVVREILSFTPEHEALAVSAFQAKIEELCNV